MSWYRMERGWMDDNVFEDEPFTQRCAWCWMIGEAQWKDGIVNILGNPVELKRGQFSDSIRFMAAKFKWSKSKVECFLAKLRKWGMITTENRTGQLIVTVCNYSKYQDKQDSNKTPNQTATGHEQDKQEELKNLRKKEEEGGMGEAPGLLSEPTAAPAAEQTPTAIHPEFEKFWKVYPTQRRGAKAKALKAWQRAIAQQRGTAQQIQTGAEQYAASDEVARGFAKGCEAWLNDDRWTLDYTKTPERGENKNGATGHNRQQAAAGRQSATDAHYSGFAQAARAKPDKPDHW